MGSNSTTERRAPSRRRFDSLEQEAYLSLWRTYDRLKILEEELFAEYELTAQQYNVLRLLRAAREPLPTLALADRLISRAPDITRMLDKLEQRGLISRTRSPADRRAVLVSITAAGRWLLDQLAEPLRQCHRQQLGHLRPEQLRQLIDLLRLVRSPHEPDESHWK
ncbi:MAG: MarR family transcriptional regulator [Gemmataceae bacterium]|jgi:DNA-binding MarR family transcriptional regulator|nr:MAG: MarR family transcriptional regulator [Gemmataceae bacterium]GIW84496.1 MAG: MarR family transcriptional regulator [Gemmataceae bacterium]